MSGNAFHKTTCLHCGVYVEYPSEAEGQLAPCPKCGGDLLLNDPPDRRADDCGTAAEGRPFKALNTRGLKPPKFVIEPQDGHVTEGEFVFFKAKARGIPTPTYQWFLIDGDNNSQALNGETTSELVILDPSAGTSHFVVQATNQSGQAQSRVATLTVEKHAKCIARTNAVEANPVASKLRAANVIPAKSKLQAPNVIPITFKMQAPKSATGLAPRPKSFHLPHQFWGMTVLAVLLVAGVVEFGVIGSSILNDMDKHPRKPTAPSLGFDKLDLYDNAKKYIKANCPGVQSFSDREDSTYQASYAGDGYCSVTIDVGGVNGFNAPIRDTLTVKMKFRNGTFHLESIDSQNEINFVKDAMKSGF